MGSDVLASRSPKPYNIMEVDVKTKYMRSLAHLDRASPKLIKKLTKEAEDYIQHAAYVVNAIECYLNEAKDEKVKLAILYLIDSIVKHTEPKKFAHMYAKFFAENIVSSFTDVFKMASEDTRKHLRELRGKWCGVFSRYLLFRMEAHCPELHSSSHCKHGICAVLTRPKNHSEVHSTNQAVRAKQEEVSDSSPKPNYKRKHSNDVSASMKRVKSNHPTQNKGNSSGMDNNEKTADVLVASLIRAGLLPSPQADGRNMKKIKN